MMKPAAAPAAMSRGSGILNRHATASATTPMQHGRHVDEGASGQDEARAGDRAGRGRRHPTHEGLHLRVTADAIEPRETG